jgi:hypothetical protein
MHGKFARRDHQRCFAINDEWQQSVVGGLDQAVIGEGAVGSLPVFERLECNAECPGQFSEIGLLVDMAACDQDPICADADLGRLQFGERDDARRQQMPDAIDLWTSRQGRRASWRARP